MTAIVATTTLSTKGQVILPKAIRTQLKWEAGTRLVVEHRDDGVVLRRLATVFAPTRPEDVFGCLPHAGAPKSVAEMDEAMLRDTRRRHARGRY